MAHCDDLGDSGASDATRTLKASLGARTFLIRDCSQFFMLERVFFFFSFEDYFFFYRQTIERRRGGYRRQERLKDFRDHQVNSDTLSQKKEF